MRSQLRVGLFFRVLALGAALVFGTIALVVTQPVLPVRARPAPLAADPAALERHVRHLAIDCVPRDLRRHENLDRAADYITARFRESGGRFGEHAYDPERTTLREAGAASRVDPRTRGALARNLSVEFGPATGPRIVIGAHYDAEGGCPARMTTPRAPP